MGSNRLNIVVGICVELWFMYILRPNEHNAAEDDSHFGKELQRRYETIFSLTSKQKECSALASPIQACPLAIL